MATRNQELRRRESQGQFYDSENQENPQKELKEWIKQNEQN